MNKQIQSMGNILFIDIETVSNTSEFDNLSFQEQDQWSQKASYICKKQAPVLEELRESYRSRAGIYAEFSKVVCISTGYFDTHRSNIKSFRLKSYYGKNETDLLSRFSEMIERHFNQPEIQFLCGHNIKEFDVPFLCRRMLINGLQIPKLFDVQNKKPWQINHLIDTLHHWRFGDYKNYTSLDVLASIFKIPSPKEKMNGSLVHEAYWESEDLTSIYKYCELDVFTVAQVYLKLKGIELSEEIEFISKTQEGNDLEKSECVSKTVLNTSKKV